MLLANQPYKFTERWGQNAPGANIQNPIPVTTSTPGRASFDQGWPTVTLTPLNAGGIPPDGTDDNGILYVLSAWAQWQQAGGTVKWDSAFSSGQTVPGYPLGAIVANATTNGFFWLNGTDGNTTNPDASGAGWTGFQVGIFPATGAQLQYASATSLLLAPKAGGFLWISGFNYAVPASCTLSNSGLSASSLYYIYAGISGGNVVLSASTTGYTVGTNGIPVQAGNAALTCVGAVSTNGSSQFVSTNGSLWVRSYFQRVLQGSVTSFAADQTSSNSTLQELSNTIRNSVLVWSGEAVTFAVTGNTSSTPTAVTAVSFDGGSPETEASAGTGVGPIGISGIKSGLSEGVHYATIFGAVSSAGTGTWRSGSAPSGSAGTAPVTITLGLGR